MQNSSGAGSDPNRSLVSRIATWSSGFWYWFFHILSKNHMVIHLDATDAFVWRRMYAFSTSILLHRTLVLGWGQRMWWIRCRYLIIEWPKMTLGTSSSWTRWFTDFPFSLLNDRSFVTLSWELCFLFCWSRIGSVCLMGVLLHFWGSECIPTWVRLHILIPYLVPWAWRHVDVLLQRGTTCDFLSWLSRLGLIFEFLCQVCWGGSQFLTHFWLRISCRLDGVWGGARFDVRAVVLNRSWWWTHDVGLWISLSRSWLLLEGWNCGLLGWSGIQIIVGILLG